MPRPYPKEFRDDVVAVARRGDAPIKQVAADFGIAESCLRNWLRDADVEARWRIRESNGPLMRQRTTRAGLQGYSSQTRQGLSDARERGTGYVVGCWSLWAPRRKCAP